MVKMFAYHLPDKGLVSRTNTELLKLSNKKQTMQFRTGQNSNRHFFKEYIQMASKHRKRCSMTFIIREMQVKPTVRYHFMGIRIAVIKNKNIK